MNSKTTLLLAILLAGLVAGYFALTRQRPAENLTSEASSAKPETGVIRDLFDDPLGNIIKVVANRGSEEWVFEKKPDESGATVWHMTKPSDAKVLSYEVDRIARETGKIQYEISYAPSSNAITQLDAGLAPPYATIVLTDETGKSSSIEIGKPVSESETYARKAGEETIIIAKSNLRKLLKAKALDYRDLQLWNFVPEQATHIEVCEPRRGQDVECLYLTRDGGQWRFDRPVKASATPKVEEMLKSLARLRVAGWHDDDASKLKVYGLDPGMLQVHVTVEETVPVAKSDEDRSAEQGDEAAEPKTEKRSRVYKLQVADRGPIGDESKVFVRSGDDSAVATIFKTAADKFKPVMSEWRDMRVVTSDTTAATRIEMTIGDETATLVKNDAQWTFEPDQAAADAHALTEFLAAIKGLKAVSFVEGTDAQMTPNFDTPQADIRLTIPGVEGGEHIRVGGYTDPAKKLLVYVRRGDSGPVAKVRTTDVATLVKPPAALRDRTILSFAPDSLVRLSIARTLEFLPGQPQSFTLEKKDDQWSMTSPASIPARTNEINNLVSALSSLKAGSIAGQAPQASTFGLDQPAITVSLTMEDAETQLRLSIARHDGKFFAMRSDDGLIYEVNKPLFEMLQAEFLSSEQLSFDPKDVQKITLKVGEDTNSYIHKDGKWAFEPEPDLPVESAKIDKIVTEIKAIKPDRYAAYASDQLGAHRLDPSFYEVHLELSPSSAAKSLTLRASDKIISYQGNPPPTPPGEPAADPKSITAHFAVLGDRNVFLLDTQTVKKIFLPLNELEKM